MAHHMYDLLEHIKEQVLKTLSFMTSMTQGNNRISKRSPNEGPAWIVAETRGFELDQNSLQ